MKPILDIAIDANVVLLVAFVLWAFAQSAIVRSPLKRNYGFQLRLLRLVLVVVVLSPVLSLGAIYASQSLWPGAPITISDVAVASYLRGEIAMPAVEFESLLNSRNRLLEIVLSGGLPWMTAALMAVLVGALCLVIQTVFRIVEVNRAIANAFVWRRTGRTDVRLSDTVGVPFAARGLWRRHVVVPSHLLTQPKTLRIVLAHEFEHLRRGDVEWELVFEMLRPVLYLNPAYLLWKRCFDRLRELNCDQAVIEHTRITPQDYARTLLDFCDPERGTRTVGAFNVAFLRFGSRAARTALETRLLALRHGRRTDSGKAAFAGLAMLLAAGIVLSAASVRNPSDWTQDRLTLSMVVNLERYAAYNRGF